MNNHVRKKEEYLKEEYLEILWRMRSEKKDSMDVLKNAMGKNFNTGIIDKLLSEYLVELNEDNDEIILTKEGLDYARKIIRAHRIAERLIYDVLGGEFESGACEFEHTVASELVDSICTLLGHPRECPHGMPIPEGECCRRAAKTAQNSVIPLTELNVGQSARIAYVSCKSDPQLYKIDGLQIRPGIFVKLHQIYPSYVIECEGANIALDKEIVSNIYVWRKPPDSGKMGRRRRKWQKHL
ncbi:metal-dependent transcriptional regulator [candidate division KSB1 bacterium]